MIKKRRLGHHGPMIFPVGVGGMSFSDFYGKTTREESFAVLTEALDRGMDHIDTANIYGMGESEKVIGAFLARQGKQAQDFFRIATKAGIDRIGKDAQYNNNPAYLRGCLIDSLKRLGVDHVDLFYVHRRAADIPIEEVVGALADFASEGLIGGFGFSEIAPASLRRAAAVHPIAAVQSEYSLQTRSPELGLVQASRDIGAAMVAFSPVGRGLLTDNPHDAERIEGLPFLRQNPRFMEPNLECNLAITDRFRRLAADMGTRAATLAVAWLLHRDDHVIPIPGTRSREHLAELAAGAELLITSDDMVRIDAILPAGWAHGDRYSESQWRAVERYC